MEKYFLTAFMSITLLPSCSKNDDVSLKTPAASEHHRSQGNIVSSPSKSWDMDKPIKKENGYVAKPETPPSSTLEHGS